LSLYGNRHWSVPVLDLVEMLKGMPSLEIIDMKQLGIGTPAREVAAVPATRLSSLNFMTMEGNGVYLNSVILSLDTPVLIGLHLSILEPTTEQIQSFMESQPVATVLASYSGQVASVDVFGINFPPRQIPGRQSLTVLPETTPERESQGGQLSVKLQIECIGSSQPNQISALLLSEAAKMQARTLSVSLEGIGVSQDTWRTLFEGAQLKTFRVTGSGAAAGIIDALGSKLRLVLFLPYLEDLWLIDVDFLTPHGEHSLSLLKVLKSSLKSRAGSKGSKVTLHVYGCTGLNEEDKAEVEDERWVGAIDWDGKTGGTEHEDEDEYDSHDFGGLGCDCRHCDATGMTYDSDFDYQY
jgi:hypothetical protein